jgi:flagellar motor component MotA
MNRSAIIGCFVAIGLLLYAIMCGSPLTIFFDSNCVLLMVVLPCAFLLQAHGFDGLKTAKKAAGHWLRGEAFPTDKADDAICVVESGAKGTLSAALICMLIGAIQILQAVGDVGLGAIGPAMAVMFLTYFYARVINQVFWHPIGRWLTQQSLSK